MSNDITIKVRLKEISDKTPDWGLGKGVFTQATLELGEKVSSKNLLNFQHTMRKKYEKLLADQFAPVYEIDGKEVSLEELSQALLKNKLC